MPYRAATEVNLGADDVAIMLGYGVLGSHLGVAFRLEDGTPKLMHLGFHKLFIIEPYPTIPRLWSAAVVPLPPELGVQVLSLLRVYAEKFLKTGEPRPNYGIALKLTEGSIQADGEYVPKAGSDGHTCSTFVAEAFRAARVPLVKLATWMESEENKAWGEAVVCMLNVYAKSRHGARTKAVAQAKAVAKNNHGFRLLPEEVAAAGQLPISQLPAEQNVLSGPAEVALAEMQAVCDPREPRDYKHCVENYRKKVEGLRQRKAAAQAPKSGAAAAA
jgi:hypothetical protein